MAKVFNILRRKNIDDEDYILKYYHESWRAYNKDIKGGFFAIFNEFKDMHLKDIEAGALKLYIYFGLHANNKNGESWHSVETIAEYFDVQTRTVDYWIESLVKRNLIYRDKKNHRTVTTYLIPYSDTLMKAIPRRRHQTDNDDLIADIVQVVNGAEKITGKIKGVYHLFQWRTHKGVPCKKDNIQWIFIVTERANGIRVGHYYSLKASIGLGVDRLELDDIYIFESTFKFNRVPLTGFALPHNYQLDEMKNRENTLELIEDLSKVKSEDIKDFPKLQYGKISEVLKAHEDEINTDKIKSQGRKGEEVTDE